MLFVLFTERFGDGDASGLDLDEVHLAILLAFMFCILDTDSKFCICPYRYGIKSYSCS